MDQWGVSEHWLRLNLKMAVPMWYMELHPKGLEHWMARKGVCSQAIAEKGDILLYGSKKAGKAGEVFNRLAEGYALLQLITGHPFESFDLRFNPDGTIEDLSDMQKENQGPQESEAVRAVCSDATEEAGWQAQPEPGLPSSAISGETDAE